MPDKPHKVLTQEALAARYTALTDLFTQSHRQNDLNQLGILIERVRAEGVLYPDYQEQQGALVERILQIALDLVKGPLVLDSPEPWWFINQVYDVVFHQVQLAEYPPVCARLYLALSLEVLHPRFHPFHNDPAKSAYHYRNVYFIQMSGWFFNRKDDFLALHEPMSRLIGDGKDDLEEDWMDRYRQFTSGDD